MTMPVRLVLAASFLACLAGTSQAQCPPPPEKSEISMKVYTDCLLQRFGPDALVTTAEVWVKGAHEPDIFPTPPASVAAAVEDSRIRIFSITFPAPQHSICASAAILATSTSGSFYYRWCKNTNTAADVRIYEAQRDTWSYSGGVLRPQVSTFYDCQNSADVVAMPPVVQAAACY